jgi:hypothetical protein
MPLIKNLYHGTNKDFKFFDDSYLGKGLGTGYIKAHWFAVSDSDKAAELYAKQLDIQNYYIYQVSIDIKKESIVSSRDLISCKLDMALLEENNCKVFNNMSFEELINENEKIIYDLLISMNILVIRDWIPDNGLCKEYIAVLTTSKSNLCSIVIDDKKKFFNY